VDERWVETLLTPDLKLKGNPGDLMALEVEVDKWHDIGFTMPRAKSKRNTRPGHQLAAKGRGLLDGAHVAARVSGPLEAPSIPGMIFEKVGEVPDWRGERPLRDSLEPVYAAASQYALEHVFGRKS